MKNGVPKSIDKVGGAFSRTSEKAILSSILPGGQNWHKYLKSADGNCRKDCPACSDPHSWPCAKLCTESWQNAPLEKMSLSVLKHVFDHFEYYNRKDIDSLTGKYKKEIGQIRIKINQLLHDKMTEEVGIEGYAWKKTRSNQNEFRNRLFDYWKGCSVTGVNKKELLIASHIKPWARSSPNEKINIYNGLMLVPNLDFLFDNGYISFSDDGRIIISKKILKYLNIFCANKNMKLIKIAKNHVPFLSYHREWWNL